MITTIIIIIIIFIIIIRCINPFKDKVARTFDAPSVLSQVNQEVSSFIFFIATPLLPPLAPHRRSHRGAAYVPRSIRQPRPFRRVLHAIPVCFAGGIPSAAARGFSLARLSNS
jgi:hypothetical protein